MNKPYTILAFKFDITLEDINIDNGCYITKISSNGIKGKKRELIYGIINNEKSIVWRNKELITLRVLKVSDINRIKKTNLRIIIFFDKSNRILIFETEYECKKCYEFINIKSK